MNFQIELVIREIQVCGFAQGKRFIFIGDRDDGTHCWML